ncbi:MAG: hypothetical protein RLZZ171_2431 [Cyanobacteriota bacterium]
MSLETLDSQEKHSLKLTFLAQVILTLLIKLKKNNFQVLINKISQSN